MTTADAFAALGLAPGASPAEINAAYRALARRRHPDAGGDAAEFAALNAAYVAASVYADAEPCPECRGEALVTLPDPGWAPRRVACPACGGSRRRHN